MHDLDSISTQRETEIYPSLFGASRSKIHPLQKNLFEEAFQIREIDPTWLHCGVFEYSPTPDRTSWIYISSGTSNPQQILSDGTSQEEFSGIGTELILETPHQASWAIVVVQRLLACNILLANQFIEGPTLDYGDRIPFGGSIIQGSVITHAVIGKPSHYPQSFQLQSGKVNLLHIFGITEHERNYAQKSSSEELIKQLSQNHIYPLTDLQRKTAL